MRKIPFSGLLAAALFATLSARAITLRLSPNSTVSSNPFEADYSSTHLYIDEINGDSIPIYIYFDPQASGTTIDEADVFTDLNNRDLVNVSSSGNGIPDGIVPPNGNLILSTSTNATYYQAYKMNGSGPFNLVLYANKTGAYRITARYHVQGDPATTFHWYGDFIDGSGLNYRDAAIVVSPTKARQMVMYEVNALNIDAEAPQNDNDYSQRSTFDDLYGGPNKTTVRPFNLNYVKGLGVNWLWVQPVHPIGVQGRQLDPNENNAPFSVGSPYSVQDFFQINPLFSKTYVSGTTPLATGEANALAEFQGFVKAADAAGINIMLDVPFNHTAYDCEFGAEGQALFGNASTSATTQFQNAVANFYSRWNGEGVSVQTGSSNYQYYDYGARAYDAGSIAMAADRFDFDKFIDVHDVYFGNYAALVDLNDSQDEGNYLNQGDWFDYSIGANGVSNDALDASTNSGNGHFDTVAQNVWKYFAWYIPYWLQQTGHTDSNGDLVGNSTNPDPIQRRMEDDRGLDGIRADFGQGLPPQCWEYIMNYSRSYKWDLVFLAESLDGGNVTYRSSRHFDAVNDNVLFDLYGDQYTSDFRSTFDDRRTAYGQGMVIWDTESHDEAGYADPYQALIRYAVDSTIDGIPDIFYGQEIGIAGGVTMPYNGSNPYAQPFGFSTGASGGSFSGYQVNFGKPIPNFMCFNSLAPAWDALGTDASGQAQLYPVYAGIGQARLSSPALQSSNRYYLNDTGNNIPANIFGVAKYANANQSPNISDVVFAFVNLTKTSSQSDEFNVNITQNGSNLFGIDPARTYNVKNIAADTEYNSTRNNVWLWGSPGITGSSVLANGVYVSLNPVPGSTNAWSTAPYEAQYLKVYDVTPPPAPGAPSTAKPYAIGSGTFTWNAASDPEGGIAGYQVLITTAPNGGGAVVFSGTTPTNSITVTGSYGQTLYATVTTINNAGIDSTTTSSSASGTILLDPNGDANGGGLTNAQEAAAGFNPLSSTYYHITSITPAAGGGRQITWTSIPGRTYQLQSSPNMSGYAAVSGTISATGTSCSYTDSSAGGAKLFYQVSTPSQ